MSTTPTALLRVLRLLKYRPDIDGLRAIAVMSVVLFHLDVPGFEGGYVGVDVFFVISGYLITSIIQHKHENHKFEFTDFYSRRIRRLVPPLIVTVAATMAAGAFVMTPYDLSNLARSSVAALDFHKRHIADVAHDPSKVGYILLAAQRICVPYALSH